MKAQPRICQVMTPFPFAVERDAGVLEARRLILEYKVRHLPVVHEHKLVGLISDRDIKLMLGPEFDYPDPRELKVGEVMVEAPYTADLETPLGQVLRQMADRHIGAALVTREGRLAGIFTATDACRLFADAIHEQFGPLPGGTDAA